MRNKKHGLIRNAPALQTRLIPLVILILNINLIAASPWHPFPHFDDFSGRALLPDNASRPEMTALIRRLLSELSEDFFVGPENDPSKLCAAAEIRVINPGDNSTSINQLTMGMLAVLLTDDGTPLNAGDGTLQPRKIVFDRLGNFHKRFRIPGSPLMFWRVNGDGAHDNGSGLVGEQNRILALFMAYNQWGDSTYLAQAHEALRHIERTAIKRTSVTNEQGEFRHVLVAGETWGVDSNGALMVDMGGQSPAYYKVFHDFGASNIWLNCRATTYWMLANLRDQPATHYLPGMSTGLVPNFMGIRGDPPFAANREYYDELDSALATFRYVLDYLWFGEESAKTHFDQHTEWWLSRHASGLFQLGHCLSEFELDGNGRPSNPTPVRAGGVGVAAMVADPATPFQNMVNSAYAIIRDYPYRNSSFRDLSKFIQLLVLTGQFPLALVSPSEKDSDNDRLPDAWEDTYGLNPHDASDTFEDLDGDGITNLLEHALAGHPNLADAVQTKPRLVLDPSNGRAGLVFRRGSNRFRYRVMVSSKLETWRNAADEPGYSLIDETEKGSTVTKIEFSISPHDQLYLRLEIE